MKRFLYGRDAPMETPQEIHCVAISPSKVYPASVSACRVKPGHPRKRERVNEVNDPVLVTALLDRLLHHVTTLSIQQEESCRLRHRRLAGLTPGNHPGRQTVLPASCPRCRGRLG